MLKNKFSKFYLYIAIATFITIMVVIIQQSYSNLIGPINTAQGSSLIKPVTNLVPLTLIDEVEKRKEYQDSEINQPQDNTDASEVSPTPASSPSIAPTLTPTL